MTVYLQPPFISDDDLVRISERNPGYQIEREKDGTLIVSPTHTKGGAKSAEATGQLRDYKKRVGGNAYDAQTGFAIGPGRRVYSPDASWVSPERIAALAAAGKDKGFWKISPDVAIEVRSETDRFTTVVKKVQRYVRRGSRYAVAIDPETREVVPVGTPPDGLTLDFDAIIDA